MSFNKILNHPSADLITRKLLKGESVREVATMLEDMYPNNKKLHISYLTLQKFRKEHLKIEGDALDVIKEVTKEKLIEKEIKQIKKLPSYKEKVQEAVNLHIDIKQQLASLHSLIMSRTEDLFDRLSSGQGTKSDEENLQKYFNTYISVLEKWAKYIDRVADYTVETNINVTVIEDQMSVLREAVWETMRELDPKVAIKFLERLDSKMKNFEYKQNRRESFQEMDSNIKILTATVEDGDK